VVLLNNHGGGIFSFLPVVRQTDIFETFFATPHSNDFMSVAKIFGLNYFRPHSISTFVKDYEQAVLENKSAIIEIFTKREKNPQQLEALSQKLKKCTFESS
jgi:2-succinyl-5-enolpyruvyl-6-hydroxy-3-cyclohexene-1-carboxylate synthase